MKLDGTGFLLVLVFICAALAQFSAYNSHLESTISEPFTNSGLDVAAVGLYQQQMKRIQEVFRKLKL